MSEQAARTYIACGVVVGALEVGYLHALDAGVDKLEVALSVGFGDDAHVPHAISRTRTEEDEVAGTQVFAADGLAELILSAGSAANLHRHLIIYIRGEPRTVELAGPCGSVDIAATDIVLCHLHDVDALGNAFYLVESG